MKNVWALCSILVPLIMNGPAHGLQERPAKAVEPVPLSSGDDLVVIETTEPAYTVFAGVPKDKVGAVKATLASRPAGVVIVTWEQFTQDPDRYVRALIVKDEYPASRTVPGIIELVRRFPGTPFGLTWNGGVAITYRQYQHARSTYLQYQADPTEYDRTRNRDPHPLADPVNPQRHLRGLLGW